MFIPPVLRQDWIDIDGAVLCVFRVGRLHDVLADMPTFDAAHLDVWGGMEVPVSTELIEEITAQNPDLLVSVTLSAQPEKDGLTHGIFTQFDAEEVLEMVAKDNQSVFDNCNCHTDHVRKCVCFARMILDDLWETTR